MSNYIDGFVFPIALDHLEEYKQVAEKIAIIWKEHGALAYFEYVGDDLQMEGTRSFPEAIGVTENETVIFGWVVFDSRETCSLAHKRVASDPRMTELVSPLMDPTRLIFNAERMVYGKFTSFISKK